MKNLSFYNILIIVGVFMFVNAPFIFLANDTTWIQLYAVIDLVLSIIAIIVGIIGNIKAMKQKQ